MVLKKPLDRYSPVKKERNSMTNEEIHHKYAMLKQLSSLPRKMVSIHGADKVADLVLHELCQPECFNLVKAAYFVDNPDFDCFKGVSGLYRGELNDNHSVSWHDHESFVASTFDLPFNKKVREITKESYRRKNMRDQDMVEQIASDLGFGDHAFCSWDMKHANHGLFIYEKAEFAACLIEEYLADGLSLLSFCPIN